MRVKDEGRGTQQRKERYRLDDKLDVHTKGKVNKDQERGGHA